MQSFSNHKSLATNCAVPKSKNATHFDARTASPGRTTATSASDASAIIHAEAISAQTIHAVPLIFDQTMTLAHRLPQFAGRVNLPLFLVCFFLACFAHSDIYSDCFVFVFSQQAWLVSWQSAK